MFWVYKNFWSKEERANFGKMEEHENTDNTLVDKNSSSESNVLNVF